MAPGTSSPGLGKLSKVVKTSRRNKASTQQLCAGLRVVCSSPRAMMQSLPSSGSVLCALRPSRPAGVPAKTLEHTVLALPRAPRLWDEGVTGTPQPACTDRELGFQSRAFRNGLPTLTPGVTDTAFKQQCPKPARSQIGSGKLRISPFIRYREYISKKLELI